MNREHCTIIFDSEETGRAVSGAAFIQVIAREVDITLQIVEESRHDPPGIDAPPPTVRKPSPSGLAHSEVWARVFSPFDFGEWVANIFIQ